MVSIEDESPEDAYQRGLAEGSERGYQLGYDEAIVETTEKLTKQHDSTMKEKLYALDSEHTIAMSNMSCKIRLLNLDKKQLRKELFKEQHKNNSQGRDEQ